MPKELSTRQVSGASLLVLLVWQLRKLKQLIPKLDPTERPVVASDLRNPENKRTAALPAAPSAKQIVTEGQEGKRSVLATLEEFLSRARQCSSLSNCVVEKAQAAIEQRSKEIAKRLDSMALEERQALPLFGLPFSVKECYLVAGTDSTCGLLNLENQPYNEDAALVAQLISLGAVPLCKTNIPQIMYAWECANPVHGITSNPLHRSFIPGGSSGGEAALIAAGGSVFGIGTDIGGSCRIPAHMSGCCGLKCTKGRVSDKGKGPPLVYGAGQQIIASCSGPLARTAADAAFVLEALCSPNSMETVRLSYDCALAPVKWDSDSFRESRPLTVGWYSFDGFMEASPACVRAVHVAVKALERSGVQCIEFKPPDVEDAFFNYCALLSGGSKHITGLLNQPGELTAHAISKLMATSKLPAWVRHAVAAVLHRLGSPLMARLIKSIGVTTTEEYYTRVAALQAYRAKFAKAFRPEFDLLLAPVHVLPAHAHMTSAELSATVSYSAIFNMLDYPAGVVPVTVVRPEDRWTTPIHDKVLEPKIRRAYEQTLAAETPFPVGVQLIGRPFTEEVVMRGLCQLEAALEPEPPQKVPARL